MTWTAFAILAMFLSNLGAAPRVSSENSTTATKTGGLSRGCPGVPFLNTSHPTFLLKIKKPRLVIGDRSNSSELISNAPGVRLVCQPGLNILHRSPRVGIMDYWVGENLFAVQLFDGRRDSCLPGWRPENSSVGGDAAEEGQREELQHDGA